MGETAARVSKMDWLTNGTQNKQEKLEIFNTESKLLLN